MNAIAEAVAPSAEAIAWISCAPPMTKSLRAWSTPLATCSIAPGAVQVASSAHRIIAVAVAAPPGLLTSVTIPNDWAGSVSSTS